MTERAITSTCTPEELERWSAYEIASNYGVEVADLLKSVGLDHLPI